MKPLAPSSRVCPRFLVLAVSTGYLALAPGLFAQAPLFGSASGQPPLTVGSLTSSAAKLDDAQLEALLGPVALYPDALIALILPAATSPSDIVLAARFLAAKGDPDKIDKPSWDESVRSLAHYPELLKWMDENLAWTKRVGEVFLAQPADVMQAVQRLRARARAAGTLVDTPQQKIVSEGQIILIEPAQPNVIYVPRYDPEVVYVTRSSSWNRPYVYFGAGFAVGSWLAYDCDWHSRTIWVGDWRRHRPSTVWVRPSFPYQPRHFDSPPAIVRQWQPPEHRHVASRFNTSRELGATVYPRPLTGTPPRPTEFAPTGQNERPYRPDMNSPATPPPPSPVPQDRRRGRVDSGPDRRQESPRDISSSFGAPSAPETSPSNRASPPSGAFTPPAGAFTPPARTFAPSSRGTPPAPPNTGIPPTDRRRDRPQSSPERPRAETPPDARPSDSYRREARPMAPASGSASAPPPPPPARPAVEHNNEAEAR